RAIRTLRLCNEPIPGAKARHRGVTPGASDSESCRGREAAHGTCGGNDERCAPNRTVPRERPLGASRAHDLKFSGTAPRHMRPTGETTANYATFILAVDDLEWTKHWLGRLRCDQLIVSIAKREDVVPRVKIRAVE